MIAALNILGFILPKLKSWLIPILIVGSILLVAAGIIWTQGNQLEKAREEISVLHETVANTKNQLMLITDNRDQLIKTIEKQNIYVLQLEQASNDVAARAAETVEQVINTAEEERINDARVGPNPQDMNLWLQNIFNL